MDKKICFAFGVSSDLVFAVGTTLIGLLKNFEHPIHKIYIFHDDIAEQDKVALLSISDAIELINFKSEHLFERLKASGIDKEYFNSKLQRYTHLYFSKFECIDLLDEPNKVLIWLDFDVLILSDFSEIILESDLFAWRPTVQRLSVIVSKFRKKYISTFSLSHIDFEKESSLNAGVIIMGSGLRSEYGVTSNSAYEVFVELAKMTTSHSVDELTFKTLSLTRNIPVQILDMKYNSFAWRKRSVDDCIVHSVGECKFWNTKSYQKKFPQWQIDYRTWLQMGGPENSKPMKSNEEMLDFLTAKRLKLKDATLTEAVSDIGIGDMTVDELFQYIQARDRNLVLQEVLQNLRNSLKNHTLKKYIKKIWIYKSSCAVVDFEFDELRFAYNIHPERSADQLSVDIISRNSVSDWIIKPDTKDKRNILEQTSFHEALKHIERETQDIFRQIKNKPTVQPMVISDEAKNTLGHPKTLTAQPTGGMNIGIMTLPLNHNYGGNLQAFALVETLRQLGHNPILINRRHSPTEPDAAKENKAVESQQPLIAQSIGISQKLPNRAFIDKFITPVSRRYTSSEVLQHSVSLHGLDAVVVGSDQVWRAKYAKGILPDFFLNFLDADNSHVRRISYAASFGTPQWHYTEDQTRMAASLLQRFDAVSVREDSAVDLCKQHLGVEAKHVLDPTMLLKAEHYINKFSLEQLHVDGNRLLTYILDVSEDKNKVIGAISEKLKLTAYSTNGEPFADASALRGVDGDRSVESWLASFYKASFVLTDSFHGVAFSILFNKPFIAYGNPKRGIARFTSLLKMFGLEDRLVTSSSEIDIDRMLQPVNWQIVNERLQELREHSLQFLIDGLSAKASGGTPSKTASTVSEAPENPLNVVCTGCGVCVSESKGALRMAWSEDGFLIPQALGLEIPEEAVRVCPFNTRPDLEVQDEDALGKLFLPNATKQDEIGGRFENCYIGYSHEFRPTSSSGGIATFVFSKLLSHGIVDYLFVVKDDGDKGYEYSLCRSVGDLKEISKTRYYPVTMEELFTKIDAVEGRVAVSGVACFIKAIRLKQHYNPEYRDKIPFLVGLICGGLKSRFYTDFLAQSSSIKGNYTKPEYRVKDPRSLASDYSFAATDPNGEVKSIKMKKIGDTWGSGLFKSVACEFCTDVLTELSDISVGDAWISEYKVDGLGNSVLITRTQIADDIIKAGLESGELKLDEVSIGKIASSQRGGVNHKWNTSQFRIWMAQNFTNLPVPFVRERARSNISSKEALVQLHRARTRIKSLQYWMQDPNAEIFSRRMRKARLSLKQATAARKDNNVDFLSILLRDGQRNAFHSNKSLATYSRYPIIRWLRYSFRSSNVGFGWLRAGLRSAGVVYALNRKSD